MNIWKNSYKQIVLKDSFGETVAIISDISLVLKKGFQLDMVSDNPQNSIRIGRDKNAKIKEE